MKKVEKEKETTPPKEGLKTPKVHKEATWEHVKVLMDEWMAEWILNGWMDGSIEINGLS